MPCLQCHNTTVHIPSQRLTICPILTALSGPILQHSRYVCCAEDTMAPDQWPCVGKPIQCIPAGLCTLATKLTPLLARRCIATSSTKDDSTLAAGTVLRRPEESSNIRPSCNYDSMEQTCMVHSRCVKAFSGCSTVTQNHQTTIPSYHDT